MDNMCTMWIKKEELDKAAVYLRSGDVVAFPTETVYGLGADATSSQAVQGIFEAKGRPSDNPLIVHIGQLTQLDQLTPRVPQKAQQLMDKFWPGPLTIILEAYTDKIAPEVTAGLSTVGIRMPNHPLALDLIRRAGCPIAAPSANTSGKPSPTTPQHVMNDLDGKIKAIVDGGETEVGLESTVIDVTNDKYPVILRPGSISQQAIEDCIGSVETSTKLEKSSGPKSPGMKYRHYSPKQPVKIIYDDWDRQISKLLKNKEKIGILANDDVLRQFDSKVSAVYSLGSSKNVHQASKWLYSGLRAFDQMDVTVILVEAHDEEGMGIAYMNRLKKASSNE